MKKRLIDRRDFIKTGIAGIGGFFIAGTKHREGNAAEQKMIYRTLGKTGLKVPLISFGWMRAGDPGLIRAAIDLGVNHIVTSDNYSMGKAEEILGETVKNLPRDSFTIATKITFRRNPLTRLYDNFRDEVTEANFHKNLDAGLKRLKMDYVDVLYHHDVRSRGMALWEPILKAMEKAKRDGKARSLGMSFHREEPEMIQAALDSNLYEVVFTTYNFKQKHFLAVRQAIGRASQAGLGIAVFKVMGGVQDPLKPFNPSAAVKWVLQDQNIHTAVLGCCTLEEMKIDLAAMENPDLNNTEKEYLLKEASLPGHYCQGCGQCEKQCIAKLPIPDLMRAHMYTYSYQNVALAYNLVGSLDLPSRICEECGQCPVRCSIGFNVSQKIKDVARLLNVPREFIV